jgi:hypothetical protein
VRRYERGDRRAGNGGVDCQFLSNPSQTIVERIWVQSWNEGAVYSADGMTIQFDNGTVWAKNVILVVPPAR